MTDLTKNFKKLGVNDLAEVCRAEEIEVEEDDNRDTLLKKLRPSPKPKD